MPAATTRTDLACALARLRRACAAADLGFDPDRLVLQEGSKTYGRCFRLFLRDAGTHGLTNVPGLGDYLGLTRREAVHALHAIASGIEIATRASA